MDCNRVSWDYELLEAVKKVKGLISNPKEYRMHPATYMQLRVELPGNGKGVLSDNWHGDNRDLTMFGLPLIQDFSLPEGEIFVLPAEADTDERAAGQGQGEGVGE
jgi:hypothetical protein